MQRPSAIAPARGPLAVLLPGMGAVATTFMAGVFLARRGRGQLFGSLTQMGTIRLGPRTADRAPEIREPLPLAQPGELAFGTWDIFPEDAYEAALSAKVLEREHLHAVKEELRRVVPRPGVFYPEYVRRLTGTHVKSGHTKAEMVEKLRADIRDMKREVGAERAVCVWCGSTEVHQTKGAAHQSIRAFEDALLRSDAAISNAQMYAWACLKERVPFANGAPNLAVDFPAAWQLARENAVPICGKDFKTGQTLMKTVIAPALKARMLGVRGWFSTNILGNRDGEVLDDPGSFKAKEESKKGALEHILQPSKYPQLYGELYHKVRIEHYPPRGDAKEGWDNIDLFGWLGYSMQMKLDFLCRDSILAAPIVLDLALLMDLAARAGFHGIQEWLSFYFKSPMTRPGLYPEHDLFIQLMKLKNTMRWMVGEEPITHLGHEYYD
jgi:myo-inositol-1-phosphate synthase